MTGTNKTQTLFGLAFSLILILSSTAEVVSAASPTPSGGFLPTDGVAGLAPVRDTPINSPIWAMDDANGMVFVGGPFTQVVDRLSWTRAEHSYLAAFDQGTGEALTWFRTQPDGPVYDIVTVSEDRILIGGEFSTVNGRPDTAGLAMIDTNTGKVDPSFQVSLDTFGDGAAKVSSIAVSGDWIYIGGNFSGLSGGPSGTHMSAFRVARVNRSTGRPDPNWKPVASGGGVWGVAVSADGQRVHLGGRFTSMNFDSSASLLATVNTSDGALTNGWNHGLPHSQPYPGFVYDVDIAPGGQLVVVGKPHFYAILDSADGSVIRDVSIPADGQTIDIDGDSIIIGCHCNRDQSWARQIDANTLDEIWATSNVSGRSGVFAANTRPDGCVLTGGELTNGTTASGSSDAVFGMALFCPEGTQGTQVASAPPPTSDDLSAPTRPGTPQIDERIASSVRLSWAPSSDNATDVTYLVLRNGLTVASTGGTSFFDSQLDLNSSYDWQVVAVDLAGNQSEPSPRSARLSVGNRTNIALAKPTSQSTTRAPYESGRAVDGNTSGSFGVGSIAVTEVGDRHADGSWWEIDLGAVTGVEQIKIYPHTDVGGGTAHVNWQMKAYFSDTPITEPNHFAASLAGYRSRRGPKAPPNGTTRIERFNIGDSFRYLRIYAGESTALEIAEVEIFTVPTSIVTSSRPADTTPPTAPAWTATNDAGGSTHVTFGGASDNVAVVAYNIYRNGSLVATTATPDAWLPGAGLLARDLTIVSIDGSGNQSDNAPSGETPVASCAFARTGSVVSLSWTGTGSIDRVVIRRSVDGGRYWWRGRQEDQAVGEFSDTDLLGRRLDYQITLISGTVTGEAIQCSEEQPPPPAETAVCSVSVGASGVLVEWESVAWDAVTVHRSVDGGRYWWRGRSNTTGAGSFTDTGLPGRSLTYELRPTFGVPGDPIACSG